MITNPKASRAATRAALLCAVIGLGACSASYKNHGYVPPADLLSQIQVGVDTRETVAETVGVPASSGVLDNSGYYYVRSRKRSIGPLAPREVDRQVVAISFIQSSSTWWTIMN